MYRIGRTKKEDYDIIDNLCEICDNIYRICKRDNLIVRNIYYKPSYTSCYTTIDIEVVKCNTLSYIRTSILSCEEQDIEKAKTIIEGFINENNLR